MEEITVFDVADETTILNKSQKQLEYEELETKGMLPNHHYKTLFELDEYLERKVRPSSNVLSIMLKWILQYCMPLIKDKSSAQKEYGIPLQLENVVYGVLGSKYVAIPTGDQFEVIGLKIPAVFVKHYSWFALAHQDHISNEDLSNTGQFGLYDMQTEKYTQQRNNFTHPGYPSIGDNTILFVDEAHVEGLIAKLIDYIDFIESYYNINYPVLRYDLIKPEVLESNKKWYIINGRVVDKEIADLLTHASQNNQSTSQKTVSKQKDKQDTKQLLHDFSFPVLHVLDKVQPSKFGKSFYMDILYMLDKNRLTHAYHVGNQLGTDDNMFKAEYATFNKKLEYDNIYNHEIQEAYAYYNRQAKKRIIALNKYGVANLDELDAKQIKVVELEYKKTMMADDASTIAIQKAFYKLRRTFNDSVTERLINAIKEVESVVDRKELENFDKLLPSGDCPHVFQHAKILQKDFGKPWLGSNLKEFLIENFSLPSDTAGYFCKLCGEKLADSDNVGAVTFMGLPGNIGMTANEEDALQTMIWKEAMYIVSNNVRFSEPTPIKPLVSSLANGLKNVIATEEAKLFRSRTSTADTIKDTLNLYASIYIYAALCAVMIANPGKLTFARDRPEDSSAKEKTISNIEQKKTTMKSNASQRDIPPGIKSEYMDNTSDVEDSGNTADVDDDNLGESEFLTEGETTNNLAKSKMAVAAGEKRRNISRKNKYRYAKGGKMVVTDNSKKASANIIKNALVLLIVSKEAIISRTKNINIQIIRNMFSNAFKWSTDHAKPIQFDREVDKQIHQDPILLDPFYNYLHYTRKIEFFNHGGFAPGINDVYNILGRYRDSVISEMKDKDVNMYATVPTPKPWVDKSSNSSNSKLSNYKAFYEKGSSFQTSNYKAFYEKYAFESFMSMYEYVKDAVYNNSFVPRHVQVSDYLNKYAYLLDDEKKVTYYRNVAALKPNIHIKLLLDILAKYNRFDPDKLDLAQHFCPTGENHKGSIFVYQDSAGKTFEYTKKDINDWLTNNDVAKLEHYDDLVLINERCSNCKNLIRDAKSSNKSSKALANMFKSIDDVLAFYQYYDTRCPLGNLHDIVDSICTKCKFHSDHGKKSDLTYYNKYVSGFRKIQLEQQQITIRSLEDIHHDKTYKKPSESTKYEYSLKNTAEWSQISGIKYNIIVNIGLSEGVKYPDIEQAKINPSKDNYSHKTRVLKLKGYIQNTLRDYMIFINHMSVIDVPLPIKDIISMQKKTDFSDMPMFEDYQKLDELYRYSLSSENYCNFLQEYLAKIMRDINEFPAGKTLMLMFTKNIIAKELMLSKANPVFYKIDITTQENGSEDEAGVSGDDWAGRSVASNATEGEFAEEQEVETYENDIDNEGYDVENAAAVWETE